MQTYIEIFDDEVNEASEQDFLAYLEVIEAVNMGLIQILPVTSCRILDNDGKCVQQGLTLPLASPPYGGSLTPCRC